MIGNMREPMKTHMGPMHSHTSYFVGIFCEAGACVAVSELCNLDWGQCRRGCEH